MRPVGTTFVLRFADGGLRLSVEQADVLPGLGVNVLQLPVSAAAGNAVPAAHPGPAPAALPVGAVVLLSGEVHAAEPVPLLLASLETRTVTVRDFDLSFPLDAHVSDAQLDVLEQRRDGEDLALLLKLTGLLLSVPDRPVGFAEAEEQHVVRIGRASWAEQLGRVGLATGVHVVARLPVGGTPDGPLSRAGRRLRAAQAATIDGRYEDAVREGRLALDALDALDPVRDPDGVKPRKSRDQAQRWAALRHDLRSLASGAHHDDGSAVEFTWTRADAVAVTAMVTALLARIQRD